MKLGIVCSILILCLTQFCLSLTYENALSSLGKDGLLHINDKNYKKLIKNENFNLIVFLTAEDARVGCTLCNEFGPKYRTIGYQFNEMLKDSNNGLLNQILTNPNDKSRVIFAISDFSNSNSYFQQLGLTAVPRLFLYEPGKGPQLQTFSNEFSFLTSENTDDFQRWVVQNIPGLNLDSLNFEPPASKSVLFTFAIMLLMLTIVFYKFQSKILSIFQNRIVWEFSSILLIILFISGYMYNQIRNTQTFKKDRDGNIEYFATGHNTQYGAETQILSIIYGVLTACLYGIIKYLPLLKDSRLKLIGTLTCCFIAFFSYSYIVQFYHYKSPSYPFYLWKP